ncbi:class I SAM-dependent rRNA methyltransferase [uncultured Duncaniella sp.]|uniref:class I SAM-dependent rRNA methyltransferase n=1 Tax=uncultured Duncaniella sp. TaxID=2768039 RepID=UPI0023C803BA|nr:class I SAM-dependent rRNA methyltransferase [uncultured Duncaniella sp.]MDE5665445.1 class I SAM-dependent rRNA methyltransferase [Duncaniella sp.]MDE5673011.1 class I SAM-dependent rRNA methyltransferase [Duncaniella sp.]MDE5961946.1 class I SAM-dependent rRNA methyltransferase [Duncaniella sp.]
MSSQLKTITLKRGKEESLLRFHPWVFSGAISHLPEGLEEGETVRVEAADGRSLGVGHYEIGSIAVRMLDSSERMIDSSFYAERLSQAWELRRKLGLIRPDNSTFRLVHGEGDFLPGCVVDIYGNTAVLQAHSPGMHFARDIIARELTRLPDAGIRNVYYKSETTLPFKARLDPVNDYIIGGFDTNIAVENGLKFNIDWLKGQKTGFFVDQRDNRSLLQKYSEGAKVLNMFCYTGGFSVYAMRGGAELVHSVDSSAKAITLTDANIELNFPGDERHKSYAEDAFKFLGRMEKGAYDLIVLDPPAFAKHRSAIRNAMIGYRRLNAAAFEKIAPGGILFTFSCSQAISKEQFRLAVFTAAAMSGRRVRILHQLTQPADHPVNIYHPEGEYLKGLVLYVE